MGGHVTWKNAQIIGIIIALSYMIVVLLYYQTGSLQMLTPQNANLTVRSNKTLTGKPVMLVVIGTRPEAIKLAPVILELKKRSEFETVVLKTGQHTDMVDQMLKEYQLDVDISLSLPNTKSQSIGRAHV